MPNTPRVLYWSTLVSTMAGHHEKSEMVNKDLAVLQEQITGSILSYQEVGKRQSAVRPEMMWIDFVIFYQENDNDR